MDAINEKINSKCRSVAGRASMLQQSELNYMQNGENCTEKKPNSKNNESLYLLPENKQRQHVYVPDEKKRRYSHLDS